LLALVLTPIIVSGGIDLSVGSMMGLAAVVLGGSWLMARGAMHTFRSCLPR
jgi:ribose/xylose/arabinose/galactoside ABC-type transport system permease subunit